MYELTRWKRDTLPRRKRKSIAFRDYTVEKKSRIIESSMMRNLVTSVKRIFVEAQRDRLRFFRPRSSFSIPRTLLYTDFIPI